MAPLPYTCKGKCKTADDPALHHHHAPSSLEYDLRIPALDDWLRYGFIPSPCAMIAAKAEYEEFKPAELTEDERNEFADLRDWVITQILDPAPTLAQVRGAAEGVDPKWPLPKGTMPREDRDDIWLVARRIYRPRARPIDIAELGPMASLLPFLDRANGADVPADVPSTGNRSSRRSRAN